MSPFTKIAVSQLLCERFFSNVPGNPSNITCNKNVISAGLDNVGQGYRLQKLLYMGSYTIDFNQTFTKMMQWMLATKPSHRLKLKTRTKSHATKSNISAIIKTISTKFSSRMMTHLWELSR